MSTQATTPNADEYSTPIPQGATVGASSGSSPSSADEYSTPIPQGAVVGGVAAPAPSKPVDTMRRIANDIDVPDNLETGALHGLAQTGAGIMGIAERLANPSGDPNNERPWFKATKNFLNEHSQNTGTDTVSRVEQGTGNPKTTKTMPGFVRKIRATKGCERRTVSTK